MADGRFHQHLLAAEAAKDRHSGAVQVASHALCKEAFDRLAHHRGLTLAGQSTESLTKLRDEIRTMRPGSVLPHPLTAQQRQCMTAGLNLELLQHPRIWNDEAGDLIPLIVDTAGWPEGRALRIVDADNDAIHLYRRGQPEQTHRRGARELPEVQDDEIILLRHGRHFDLLRRDQDNVIDTVSGDGDCFFSCISKALGHADIAASNLALRRDLADYLWSRPDLLPVVAAYDGPLQEQRAATPAAQQADSAINTPVRSARAGCAREGGIEIPATDYPTDDQALATLTLPGIVDFYEQEMTRILAGKPLSVAEFDALHRQLSSQLATAAQEADAPMATVLRPMLDRSLREAREVFHAQNALALRRGAERAINIVQTARQTYIEKIDAILAEHPGGLSPNRLQQGHDRIVSEVRAGLEQRMRSEIHADEPMDGHFASLMKHIEPHWIAASDENNQRISAQNDGGAAASDGSDRRRV